MIVFTCHFLWLKFAKNLSPKAVDKPVDNFVILCENAVMMGDDG